MRFSWYFQRPPSGWQLVMQLLYTMLITNNHAPFHLWRQENLEKHQKVSKYYDQDCSFCFLPDFDMEIVTSSLCFFFHNGWFIICNLRGIYFILVSVIYIQEVDRVWSSSNVSLATVICLVLLREFVLDKAGPELLAEAFPFFYWLINFYSIHQSLFYSFSRFFTIAHTTSVFFYL